MGEKKLWPRPHRSGRRCQMCGKPVGYGRIRCDDCIVAVLDAAARGENVSLVAPTTGEDAR